MNEIENVTKDKNDSNIINIKTLQEEILFRIKFNQNFSISSHLRDIDLYCNSNSNVSIDKKQFKFQQQKGFQFKNLKKIYLKTKEDYNSESESLDVNDTRKSGIFDYYNSNDHDKFFNSNQKNSIFKNTGKEPNSNLNNRKSSMPGYISSLSMITKKNDLCKGEPHLNLKLIMENQVCIIFMLIPIINYG